MPRLWLCVLLLSLAAGCAGDGFPRDARGTLAAVRGGTLVVGVAVHPPWVTRAGDEAQGVEPALVRALADSLGADVRWVWGGAEGHLEALAAGELDLVAAGLTARTPWRGRVGLTRPYYTGRIVAGLRPTEEHAARTLDGRRVAVPPGSPFADRVRAHGGLPVVVADPVGREPLVADEAWRLVAQGYAPMGPTLDRSRHVLAVPPGEHAWLLYVERFLEGRGAAVHRSLVAAAGGS